MSQSKSQHEAERWWLTANDDLDAAKTLHAAGKYSHACFLSQQSTEKANFLLVETHKLMKRR